MTYPKFNKNFITKLPPILQNCLEILFLIRDWCRRKRANVETVIFGNMHLTIWANHTHLTNVEYHLFGMILILPSVTNLPAWYVVVRVLCIV